MTFERDDGRVERHYEPVRGFPPRESASTHAMTFAVVTGWVSLWLAGGYVAVQAGMSTSLAATLAVGAIAILPIAISAVAGPRSTDPTPVLIVPRHVNADEMLQVDVRFDRPVREVAFVIAKPTPTTDYPSAQKRVIDVVLSPVVVDSDPDAAPYRCTIPRAAASAPGRWFVAVTVGRGLQSRLLPYRLNKPGD